MRLGIFIQASPKWTSSLLLSDFYKARTPHYRGKKSWPGNRMMGLPEWGLRRWSFSKSSQKDAEQGRQWLAGLAPGTLGGRRWRGPGEIWARTDLKQCSEDEQGDRRVEMERKGKLQWLTTEKQQPVENNWETSCLWASVTPSWPTTPGR